MAIMPPPDSVVSSRDQVFVFLTHFDEDEDHDEGGSDVHSQMHDEEVLVEADSFTTKDATASTKKKNYVVNDVKKDKNIKEEDIILNLEITHQSDDEAETKGRHDHLPLPLDPDVRNRSSTQIRDMNAILTGAFMS